MLAINLGVVRLHRPGPDCPACGGDAAAANATFCKTIRQLLLRTLPCVPVANNWTKISPCLQFAVSGILVHQVLPALFHIAFQAFAAVATITSSNAFDELDPAMREEVYFRQINGVRIEKTRVFFDDLEVHAKLIMLALVMEPMQWLTSILLSNSAEALDLSRRPFIFDCLLPARSPFTVAMQLYSTMLSGKGSRLSLLFRSARCHSFEEWGNSNPHLLKLFCAAILTASAWIWRRHHHELQQHPWQLMALADVREHLSELIVHRLVSSAVGFLSCWCPQHRLNLTKLVFHLLRVGSPSGASRG